MGCFSWDCDLCGRSLRGSTSCRPDPSKAWASEVVLVPDRGDRMEGTYDGYGRVGRRRIPKSWDYFDGAELKRMADEWAARAARDRKTAEELAALSAALPDVARMAEELRLDAERTEETAERFRADAKRFAETNVAFTAYHWRCWEAAGRPGFRAQSKPSFDQGTW